MRLAPAGFADNPMDTSVSGPRTRILALTGEVELHRLLRSILEPSGCKLFMEALPGAGAAASEPVDIVIVDLESPDLDLVSRIRRDYPGTEILAIGRAHREADCIAILEMDVDYLSRPFRAQDLAARVRVAELRRFKAAGGRRFYRRGSFVIDLFDRSVALDGEPIALAPVRIGPVAAFGEQARTFGDLRRYPGGVGADQLGQRSPGAVLLGLSSPSQNRTRPDPP